MTRAREDCQSHRTRRRTVTKVGFASIAVGVTGGWGKSETITPLDKNSPRQVERTFRNVMPPRCIEGVVGAPSVDARAVRLAGAILVLVRRPKLGL